MLRVTVNMHLVSVRLLSERQHVPRFTHCTAVESPVECAHWFAVESPDQRTHRATVSCPNHCAHCAADASPVQRTHCAAHKLAVERAHFFAVQAAVQRLLVLLAMSHVLRVKVKVHFVRVWLLPGSPHGRLFFMLSALFHVRVIVRVLFMSAGLPHE